VYAGHKANTHLLAEGLQGAQIAGWRPLHYQATPLQTHGEWQFPKVETLRMDRDWQGQSGNV
jgi:hypothetical protein